LCRYGNDIGEPAISQLAGLWGAAQGMRCPRQRIWRFALQLWLAAGPVVNHLMSVVGHIFQPRISSRVRKHPTPKPDLPSILQTSTHGELTAIVHATAWVGLTSTVTCDNPLKRLIAK
jgi:hypothetical protein